MSVDPSIVESAVFIGETTLKAAGWLWERRQGPEIDVLDMFYDPGVLVPRRWKFDEDSFRLGMPVRVVNHSSKRHYTISFFQFQTDYKDGKKFVNHEHQMIPLANKNDRTLNPKTAKEFALPWKAVELSAAQARVMQQKTTRVGDLVFYLTFHDDYDNKDYPRNPKALYPFRLRSEASQALGKL